MMKRSLLLAFGLSLSLASAQEHVDLPLTVGHLATRDGKVYEGAVIVGQDDVGVKIQHDGGTARIVYDRLPNDLAKQFSLEAQEGKAHQDAEAERQKEVAKATSSTSEAAKKKAAKNDEGPKGYVPDAPPPQDPEILKKIASLRSYIFKLEKGMADAKIAAEKASSRAQELRARSEFTVTDSNGLETSHVNGSLIAKANFQDNLAEKEAAKIAEADRLIAEAERKISVLQNTPPPAPKPVKPEGS